MTITIDDYERLKMQKDSSCYEKLVTSIKQINILKAHIEKLENDIKNADGYTIKVIE
jgi:hypothetical protein